MGAKSEMRILRRPVEVYVIDPVVNCPIADLPVTRVTYFDLRARKVKMIIIAVVTRT